MKIFLEYVIETGQSCIRRSTSHYQFACISLAFGTSSSIDKGYPPRRYFGVSFTVLFVRSFLRFILCHHSWRPRPAYNLWCSTWNDCGEVTPQWRQIHPACGGPVYTLRLANILDSSVESLLTRNRETRLRWSGDSVNFVLMSTLPAFTNCTLFLWPQLQNFATVVHRYVLFDVASYWILAVRFFWKVTISTIIFPCVKTLGRL